MVATVEARLKLSRPDAIVEVNDQIAIAALRAIRQAGLDVPTDILVAGFNALESQRYCWPELTTASSPAIELGMEAAPALLGRLGDGSFRRKEIVLPVRLQPGGTT